MSNRQRVLTLAAAAAIAVVAFVALKPGDESSDGPESRPANTTSQGGGGAAPEDSEPRRPPVTRIRVEGNEPVGGAARISARKGERVQIEVVADAPEEVHLHGYDLFRGVAQGGPARF